MHDILIATTPAMTLALGAGHAQISSIGKEAVLLLGFSQANETAKHDNLSRETVSARRASRFDHRPPPRWGINE